MAQFDLEGGISVGLFYRPTSAHWTKGATVSKLVATHIMRFLIIRFVARCVFLIALAAQAQSLINVDLGGNASSSRFGPAAVGLGTNDVWNGYTHYPPHFTPGMPSVANGRLEALKYSDASISHVAVAITNAPGVWGNASGDSMFDSFVFAARTVSKIRI